MKITLVSSGDTVSNVLNRFETNFSLDWVEIKEEFTHLIVSMPDFLIKKYSIRELKAMTDFLASAFNITDLGAPKRNSKVSLAGWIGGVLLSAREVAEASGAIAPTELITIQATEVNQKVHEYRFLLSLKEGENTLWYDGKDFVSESWSAKTFCKKGVGSAKYQLRSHPKVRQVFCTWGNNLQVTEKFFVSIPEVKPPLLQLLEAPPAAKVELAQDAIAAQPVETSSPQVESGLIISFGKTLEFLPHKTVTRRAWKDVHAQKFINAFNQNKLVKAFDKDVRYGGKQIGWCRLSCAPYKERLCDMPKEDLLAEGGMCDTIGEFVQQYFDGNPRLEVWVIRFEFIAGLALAAETNPVVAADQVADSSSLEIEVLEPEEKPVYTISIITDGSFSEERVNRLPPYLIDRKGNLLKKFWHYSCDAGYSEIASQHLSNIAVDSGLVVELMAESLKVSDARIRTDPPPFIIDRSGGVYKRDCLKLSLAVRYAQVVSEYLSNIVVV